jgi:hypothetical protein
MTLGSALLLLLAALPADLSAEDLVQRLGSADRIEQEEAARSLEELGADALPALRAAAADRMSAPPLVRARAAALLERVEGRLLTEPTRVVLDFDGQPLGDVLAALGTRTGFTLTLDPGGHAELPRRAIRAGSSGKVAFWTAVERVARAGGIRLDPEFPQAPNTRATVVRLIPGAPPAFSLEQSGLRLQLLRLDRRRDREFVHSPDRPDPAASDALYVEVQAFAEPGRFLEANGLPHVEAIDERGQPLPPPPSGAKWPDERSLTGKWVKPGALNILQWRIPLGLPDQAISRLRHLRGTLPLIVSSRRPDPLVIRLEDASGQTFHHAGSALRFGAIPPVRFHDLAFELFVTPDDGASPPRGGLPAILPRTQLTFEDAKGEPLSWHPVFSARPVNGKLRISVSVTHPDRPVRLAFGGLVATAAEVPFEFNDVPMP